MSSLTALATLRAHQPGLSLIADTQRQLEAAFSGWDKLGKVEGLRRDRTVRAWPGRPDDPRRLQITANFAVRVGQDQARLFSVVSLPLGRAFSGLGLSSELKQEWYSNLARAANTHHFGTNFAGRDAGSLVPERHKYLKPWETLRFSNVQDTELTVERINVLTDEVVSARTFSYGSIPGDAEGSILRIEVAGAYVDTGAFLRHAAAKTVGDDERAAKMLSSEYMGGFHQSMKPEAWIRVNLGRGVEEHRRISRALGEYEGPVLEAQGESLKLVVRT